MRWRWTKVRRAADLPQAERDLLERFGPDVIRMVLVSGHAPASPDLQPLYNCADQKKRAGAWLTEKSDQAERREDRLETMELAILVLVGLEVWHYFGVGPIIKRMLGLG